jgi:hypothetical protein
MHSGLQGWCQNDCLETLHQRAVLTRAGLPGSTYDWSRDSSSLVSRRFSLRTMAFYERSNKDRRRGLKFKYCFGGLIYRPMCVCRLTDRSGLLRRLQRNNACGVTLSDMLSVAQSTLSAGLGQTDSGNFPMERSSWVVLDGLWI